MVIVYCQQRKGQYMDANGILRKLNQHQEHHREEETAALVEETAAALALLQEILAHAPVGLALVSGPQFVFQLASPAYYDILPDPQAEVIGLPYAAVWPLEQGFNATQLLQEMIETEKDLQVERIEHRFPDGQTRSFSIRFRRMAWKGETGVLIMMQETTSADQANRLVLEIADDANRQAEEMSAVISAMAEAVILFDARGQAIRANPAALALYGIDPVGISQEELAALLGIRGPDGGPIQPEDLPVHRALLGQAIISERLLMTGPDEEEHMLYVSASPLVEEDAVYGVITILHDMTDRERLLEQLEIEQSRLKTIIENAPEAIVVADEEGRIVMGNPAAERLFSVPIPYGEDISTHAALGLHYPDGTPYDPRNLPLTSSAVDGGRLFNVELLAKPENQGPRHILASTAPIIDRKGNLNGAVGILQDITERKQAVENLRWNTVRLQLLAVLSQAFAEAGLNYRDLLDTIVQQVGHKFGNFCSLHIFDEEAESFSLAAVYIANGQGYEFGPPESAAQAFPIREGVTGWVYETGHPVLLKDVANSQYLHLFPSTVWEVLEPTPQGVHLVSVPMRVHGRRIGVLNVLRTQDQKPYAESDLAFLQDLADRAALALEDARLYERKAQRARELEALHRATTRLLSTIDLDSMIAQGIESCAEIFPEVLHGMLFLMEPETQQLKLRVSYGDINDPQLRGSILDAIQPLVEQYAREKVRQPPFLLETQDAMRFYAVIAPLVGPNGVLGVLALINPESSPFQKNDLTLLDSFAALASAALQNAMLYSEVNRLATTDVLTGLYNRRKFFELGELEIHRYKRFKSPLSAIMLDLDNFKQINDTYGHATGDVVLRAVAIRSKVSIRVIDILGRYGGDEFAILLPNTDIHEAEEIAERIRRSVMEETVEGPNGVIQIAISLGITQAGPDTDCLSDLLARADTALYSAKEKGKNRTELR